MKQIIAVCFRFGAIIPITLRKVDTAPSAKKGVYLPRNVKIKDS